MNDELWALVEALRDHDWESEDVSDLQGAASDAEGTNETLVIEDLWARLARIEAIPSEPDVYETLGLSPSGDPMTRDDWGAFGGEEV